ncbi:MAG TPA: carboxypeptidase-like regulatory domain-containing protein, partial [Bryobacteraceae bacterium]|nr:carboxypeptidase-like regulatory domain-containing protein [Bryobacteraceae bacterium]
MLRFLTLLAVYSSFLYSQSGTGTISGTVLDPAGAAVAGATVEVRNLGTTATFGTTTNESGFYTAPGLRVGDYEVVVQHPGFKRLARSGITLQVGQNAQVNISLEIGQTTESIQVTAEAPLVDTGSATVGEVIENRRVTDLPINGRNALALTVLNPGVISNAGPTQSGFGDRGVDISSLSINGSPNGMNSQMLDGANNILSYVGEVGIPPAVDAVEEFRVQSGAMSAEFGFTA